MIKILIADDEQIELEYLQMILGQYPEEFHLVGWANNGRDAVRVGKATPLDLAILDISMPFQNGIEAGRILKSFHPGLSVILNSAYSEFDYARDALKYGFDDYLIKPTKQEKIIHTIRKVACQKKTDADHSVSLSKKLVFSKLSQELIASLFTFKEDFLAKQLKRTETELLQCSLVEQKYYLQIFILLLETTLKDYGFDTCSDSYPLLLKNASYQLDQGLGIEVILPDLIRSYKQSVIDNTRKGSFAIDQVLDFVDNHFTNPELSLSFLSKRFFVNPSYLSRVFSQSTNRTLTAYIRNKRLARAKNLCLETQLPIEEISLLSGFRNKQQFYKYFYETYQKTPLEMRSTKHGS